MSAASDLVACLAEEQKAFDEIKDLLPRAALEEAENRKAASTLFLRKLANNSKDRRANYLSFKDLAVKSVRFKAPKRKVPFTLHRIMRNAEPGFSVRHSHGLEFAWIPDSSTSPVGGKRFDRDVPRMTWGFDFDGQRTLITYELHGGVVVRFSK